MDDFFSQARAVLEEKPEPDFFSAARQIVDPRDPKVKAQDGRMSAAREWAMRKITDSSVGINPFGDSGPRINLGKEIGSKTLGGVGLSVGDALRSMVAFGSAIGTQIEGKDYQTAKEAYEKGEATDAQLGQIAEYELLQQREQARSTRSTIAKAALGVPAILGETLVAAPVAGAGVTRIAGLGKTPLGKGARAAATMGLATPGLPSSWLPQAQQRAIKNGGEWYDSQNLGPAGVEAVVKNAVLGQIAQFAGKGGDIGARMLPSTAVGRTLGRVGGQATFGGVAMPVETQLAEAGLQKVSDELVKRGEIDEKYALETHYGAIGLFVDGKDGEAWKKLATEAVLGAGFAAFHKNRAKPVEAFKKVVDKLGEAGVPKEIIPKIIEESMKNPEGAVPIVKDYLDQQKIARTPPEGAPKDPGTLGKPKPAPTVLDEAMGVLGDWLKSAETGIPTKIPKRVEAAGERLGVKYEGSDTPQSYMEKVRQAINGKPPAEPVRQPEPVKPPEPPKAPEPAAEANPLGELTNAQIKELSEALGFKAIKDFKAKAHEPWVKMVIDSMLGKPQAPRAPKEELYKDAPTHDPTEGIVRPDVAEAPPEAPAEQRAADLGPPAEGERRQVGLRMGEGAEPLNLERTDLSPDEKHAVGKYGKDQVFRVPLVDAKGERVGRVLIVEEPNALVIPWGEKTGLAAGEGRGKAQPFGPREIAQVARQLAELYPDKEFVKYVPAEGRIRVGEQRIIPLDRFRKKLDPNARPEEPVKPAEEPKREGVYKTPEGQIELGTPTTAKSKLDPGIGGDAMGMFPAQVKPGQKVARIHGIEVKEGERGKGHGQKLYLEGMKKHGADWYYNSQAEPGAVRALQALERKGEVELHWKGEPGGPHIVRVKPAEEKAPAVESDAAKFKKAALLEGQGEKAELAEGKLPPGWKDVSNEPDPITNNTLPKEYQKRGYRWLQDPNGSVFLVDKTGDAVIGRQTPFHHDIEDARVAAQTKAFEEADAKKPAEEQPAPVAVNKIQTSGPLSVAPRIDGTWGWRSSAAEPASPFIGEFKTKNEAVRAGQEALEKDGSLAKFDNERFDANPRIKHRFPGEGGMESYVEARGGDKFAVGLRDREAGKTVPEWRIFNNEADAVAHAKSLVGKGPKKATLGTPAKTEPAKGIVETGEAKTGEYSWAVREKSTFEEGYKGDIYGPHGLVVIERNDGQFSARYAPPGGGPGFRIVQGSRDKKAVFELAHRIVAGKEKPKSIDEPAAEKPKATLGKPAEKPAESPADADKAEVVAIAEHKAKGWKGGPDLKITVAQKKDGEWTSSINMMTGGAGAFVGGKPGKTKAEAIRNALTYARDWITTQQKRRDTSKADQKRLENMLAAVQIAERKQEGAKAAEPKVLSTVETWRKDLAEAEKQLKRIPFPSKKWDKVNDKIQSLRGRLKNWDEPAPKPKATLGTPKAKPVEPPAPKPAPEIPEGQKGIIAPIHVAGDKPIDAQYQVRELADLTASHEATPGGGFADNVKAGRYPAELQPRDYSNDRAEKDKVEEHARVMEPRFYISENPDATSGPPTITENGTVINGNGRTMSLQVAVRSGTFDKYRAALEKDAQKYGIDPEALKGMKNPVLVRVVDLEPASPEAAKFARAGNVSMTQGQSPVRTAASLGGIVDDAVINSLNLEGDTTFSEAVMDPTKGRAFRKRLMEALPPSERPKYFQDGNLTPAGQDLVRNMLLSKVLPLETVEALAEVAKAERRAIEGAVPQLLKLKRDYPNYDISDALNEAAAFFARHPDMNTDSSVENVLSQQGLFGSNEKITPAGRMMLDFLMTYGGKPRVFRDRLVSLVSNLDQSTKGLFADEAPDPVAIAAQSLGVRPRTGADFAGVGEAVKEFLKDELSGLPKELGPLIAPEDPLAPPPMFDPGQTGGAGPIMPGEPGRFRTNTGQQYERKFALAEEYVTNERAARGRTEVIKEARRGNQEAFEEGMARLRANPQLAEELITRIEAGGKIDPDRDVPALLVKRVSLSNQADTLTQQFNREHSAGRLDPERAPAVEEIRRKLADVLTLRDRLDNATSKVGTWLGRALQYFQVLAKQDYSLDRILSRAAFHKKGPLTPEEAAIERKSWERLQELEKRLAELLAEKEAAEKPEPGPSITVPEKAPGTLGGTPKPTPQVQKKGAIQKVKDWFGSIFRPAETAKKTKLWSKMDKIEQEAYDALKGDKLYSGFDPALVVPLAKYTAAKIVKAGLTLKEYTERIIAKFGKDVEPYVEEIWEKANDLIEDAKLDVTGAKVKIREKRGEIDERNQKRDREHWSTGRQAVELVKETNNAVRAFITSGDLSSILRQGGFITAGHPLRAMKALPDLIKSLKSEEGFQRAQQELRDRNNGLLYRESGLYLADHAEHAKAEESYVGRWVKRIPGVAASQRAYTGFLNRLRADSFDAMVASMSRNGTPTLPEMKAIANFINVATGRGKVPGELERAANAAANIFFSPRYVLSRFQLATGQPIWGGTARTRQAIAGEYVRAALGVATFLGVAKLLLGDEAKIGTDSRSADFLKVKIGKTRLDAFTGLAQIGTLTGRLAHGQTKSTAPGGAVTNLRGRNQGRTSALETLGRFGQAKLAPLPGLFAERVLGSDPTGRPPTLGRTAKKLTIPIAASDIREAVNDLGPLKGGAIGILSMLGMSSQTYGQ